MVGGMDFRSRIVLCRHGVTDFTIAGRWDGRGGADPDLNAAGRAQAEDLATRVQRHVGMDKSVRVLSSSLARARQTAAPVAAALGVSAVVDRDWDELAFGEWDSRTGTDLRAALPDEVLRFWEDETFRVPGGESHIDLHTRVRPAFQSLLDAGGTTIVVSHWGPIMSCLSLVLGMDLLPARRLLLAPTSMSSIAVAGNGPVVEFVNDLSAITPVEPPRPA